MFAERSGTEQNRNGLIHESKPVRFSFFNSLLSCSPSRVLIKHRHSGSAQAVYFGRRPRQGAGLKTAVEQALTRGLVPHDRGFVLELPLSRRRASARPAHNRHEGSPPRPAPSRGRRSVPTPEIRRRRRPALGAQWPRESRPSPEQSRWSPRPWPCLSRRVGDIGRRA
jgi:hypothetical protein